MFGNAFPQQLWSYTLPKDTSAEDLRMNAIEDIKRGAEARFDEALAESRNHHQEHPPFELHRPDTAMNEIEKALVLKAHREALKRPFVRLGLDDEMAALIVDEFVLELA